MGKAQSMLSRYLFFFISLNSIVMMILSCKIDNKTDMKNNVNEPESILHPFYDFNFKIVIYREPLGVTREIFYQHNLKHKKNDRFKVVHFKYHDEKNLILEKPLKKVFYIEEAKMDTIFNVISKKVTPKFSINYGDKKIPPPPIGGWEYCTVELDLLFRGNTYLMTTSNTAIFNDLLNILQP